jgi:hypothetical protein
VNHLSRDLRRLTKQAVGAIPPLGGGASPDGPGELKAYQPSTFQRAKDWWHQKTAPGMLGPNQSSVNSFKNIVGNTGVQLMAGGIGKIPGAISTGVSLAQTAGNAFTAPVTPQVTQQATPQVEGEGFDWQSMAPFLLAALPMLLGGGGQPETTPAAPTSIDRLAQMQGTA